MNKKTIFLKGLFYIFLAAMLLGILIFFHFRGVIYYDEGYILNSALRVVYGQVPYRDFDIIYMPISFLTTAVFFKILGVSVFTERVTALIVSIASLIALYKILTLITKNKLITLLSLLFFVSWGPAHINFTAPTMFAVCFFLYSTLFYLKGSLEMNKKYFYIAGIITIMIFFSKQNFGTGTLLISLFSFLYLDKGIRRLSLYSYLLGVSTAILVSVLMLVGTSSLLPFINNIYVYTFKNILVNQINNTAFLYEGALINKFAKLVFYLSPLLFSTHALFELRKSGKRLFVTALFPAAFYLFGIRPTTDYVHLVALLAISVIPLVASLHYAKKFLVKAIAFSILIGMTFLGFYTANFGGYYKWESPLHYQTSFAENSRLHVYLTIWTSTVSQELTSYIDKHTKHKDYIFLNYYAPMIYFIADRINATRYDYVSPSALSYTQNKEIVRDLQNKKVRLVIVHISEEFKNSLVANYIRKHYQRDQRIGDYIMYIHENFTNNQINKTR